jgi:hypothetical protein
MIFQSNRGSCNAEPASGVVVVEKIPQNKESHMFRLLFSILAVIGCTDLVHPKNPDGVVFGSIDTGVDASSTEDTGGATAECEEPPDGFESTLDRGHSCSDIYLERHNEDGTIQVTFSISSSLAADAALAMETQVTVIDLADEGMVMLKMGENLGEDACVCVDGMEVIEHSYVVTAGTAEVEITPRGEGDEGHATVRLSGVVLLDEDSCEQTLGDMEFSGTVGLPIG